MQEYSKEWADRYRALLKTGETYPKRWYEYHNMILDTVIAAVCQPDQCSIDVGCYTGRFTGLMSQLSQRVYAIDPNLESYALGARFFAHRPKKNWWMVRRPERIVFMNVAVADRKGTSDYYESEHADGTAKSGWNSMLGDRENALSQNIHRRRAGRVETRAGSIPVERLDDIIHRDVPVGFVKIDVEGLERQVIKGARQIINNRRPVLVYEAGWASQLIKAQGYLLWPLGHVLGTPVTDGNSCMLNMLAIPEERSEEIFPAVQSSVNALIKQVTDQLGQGYYDRQELQKWHGQHLLEMTAQRLLMPATLPDVTPTPPPPES